MSRDPGGTVIARASRIMLGTGAEHALYQLAKWLSPTELAHSTSMKAAAMSMAANDEYRSTQAARVLAAARDFGIGLDGRDLLDLGCNDGALTAQYATEGPTRVIGIDINADAVHRAASEHSAANIEYRHSTVTTFPIEDDSVDVIFCYDVFEHVAKPSTILDECRRVLRPGGSLLIGTWGWGHPFAPHLWATMPVPWAHVLVSEATLLRACRRVYEADWYRPTFHDLDADGRKIPGRYSETSISTDYLNKFTIRDFERVFAESGLSVDIRLVPFGSRKAAWTKPLLRSAFFREYLHGYLWACLRKRPSEWANPLAA
jgi:2-polyprenyl-3-methyl-5-hydroxy-6-metoxy-1,4-benzoquinol methylase